VSIIEATSSSISWSVENTLLPKGILVFAFIVSFLLSLAKRKGVSPNPISAVSMDFRTNSILAICFSFAVGFLLFQRLNNPINNTLSDLI
jgi:hypothetical protein